MYCCNQHYIGSVLYAHLTNKSPVHVLYHDVVGRISVPFSKLSPTTIALPYVAWQRNQLISVRRIS